MVDVRWHARHALGKVVDWPIYPKPLRARYKHQAELAYWQGELGNLDTWFNKGTSNWWGLPPVQDERKTAASSLWSTNAILTLHDVRPTYHEELQLDGDAFAGERVLEIGCGPLVPILQFDKCERHGIDPLLDDYINTGWPTWDLDARLLNAHGENLPYPDDWFDSVISVNALDHVDDFEQTAREMQRVLRPGGRIIFEVEYHHEPTPTEPISLNDTRIRQAFARTNLQKQRELSSSELFASLMNRFGLVADQDRPFGSGEQYALWSGIKA